MLQEDITNSFIEAIHNGCETIGEIAKTTQYDLGIVKCSLIKLEQDGIVEEDGYKFSLNPLEGFREQKYRFTRSWWLWDIYSIPITTADRPNLEGGF